MSRQIDESIRIRNLRSELLQCLVNKENSVLISEKNSALMRKQKTDQEYGNLLKDLCDEEKKYNELESQVNQLKNLCIQGELENQMVEKKTTKALEKAEELIKQFSALDEVALLQKEKEREIALKDEKQKKAFQDLQSQICIQNICRKKYEEEEKATELEASRHNLIDTLKNEVQQQQAKMESLQQKYVQVGLITNLAKQLDDLSVRRELRSEIECLEKDFSDVSSAQETASKKHDKEREILDARRDQIRFKNELLKIEKEKEDEYKRILLELQYGEDKLFQIKEEARRRKQVEHRHTVQVILEARHQRREKIVELMRQQLQRENLTSKLREEILAEEERELLLTHAPQLERFLTHSLLTKLASL